MADNIAPSTKVLGTYELLEHILLHLPLRTLLLSRRVNKVFLDVVTRSQDIQEALFLKPRGNTVAVYKRREAGVPRFICEWKTAESDTAVKPLLNPFFEFNIDVQHIRHLSPRCQEFALIFEMTRAHSLAFRNYNETTSSVFGTIQGAMLISQPAPRSMRNNSDIVDPTPQPMGLHRELSRLPETNDAVNTGGLTFHEYSKSDEEAEISTWSDYIGYRADRCPRSSMEFLRPSRTVDEITGCEMLELLQKLHPIPTVAQNVGEEELAQAELVPHLAFGHWNGSDGFA